MHMLGTTLGVPGVVRQMHLSPGRVVTAAV